MHANVLHCSHCGVKRRDDRSAFFTYDQITDQIKAVNVSGARLIEHRAVAVEGNAQRVQKVGRVVPPSANITRSKVRTVCSASAKIIRGRPASSSISLMFELRSISTSPRCFHCQERIVVLLIEPREICLSI